MMAPVRNKKNNITFIGSKILYLIILNNIDCILWVKLFKRYIEMSKLKYLDTFTKSAFKIN